MGALAQEEDGPLGEVGGVQPDRSWRIEGGKRRMKFLKRANHTAFSTMSCQLTVLLCVHDKEILQPCLDPQLYTGWGGREGGREEGRRRKGGEGRGMVREEGSAQEGGTY